jgi:malonyl-CoA/methylmalonyl-CoA synthetase
MTLHPVSATDPVDWLEHAVRTRPGHCFIESADGAVLTYADVYAWSGRFAAALATQGVGAGDRVAVQVDKSPQVLMLYLGCLRLGAVFLPLNTAYPPAEIAYFLQDATPRLFVARPADQAARSR